jgi:hypothetical protein
MMHVIAHHAYGIATSQTDRAGPIRAGSKKHGYRQQYAYGDFIHDICILLKIIHYHQNRLPKNLY